MKTRVLLIVVGLIVFFQSVQAPDWPQWRGPQRNGISPEAGLLKEWPKNVPKLLWRIDDVDYGYSTPAVVGDGIYLLSNERMDDESVRVFAVRDGKHAGWTRLGQRRRGRRPQAVRSVSGQGSSRRGRQDRKIVVALRSDRQRPRQHSDAGSPG